MQRALKVRVEAVAKGTCWPGAEESAAAAADATAESAASAAAPTPAAGSACPACLGILQMDPSPYALAPGAAASGDQPSSATPVTAAEYVAGMRAGGHVLKGRAFALEVTLPPALAVRQAAIRAHLQAVLDASLGSGADAGNKASQVEVIASANGWEWVG
jgi:hypothetical protein